MSEHEITARGPLLDETGRLREPGWAKELLLDYDRSAVRARPSRIKEWDYYCVLSGDHGVALTIADNGYMGLVSATVLDFAAGTELTETMMVPFTMGGLKLPATSAKGHTVFHRDGVLVRFENTGDGERTLLFAWTGFGASRAPKRPRSSCCAPLPPEDGKAIGAPDPMIAEGVGLEGEITLRPIPGGDSMVIATPFKESKRAFYYNQKVNCQEAEGVVRLGRRELRFEKGSSFGVLDWGRGVWPYANTWLWGSASGLAEVSGSGSPLRFGFNIGYGFGDTSAASENMVFVEGKAHKLGRLSIELDEKDFLKPWRARSEDGRFDLRLDPVLDRHSDANLLLIASNQHQVFGRWSGTVLLEDGRKVEVRNLLGFCEKVRNRW